MSEYARLLADIADGARLHYDEPGEDPDLSLLQGDRSYAEGLARLAALGDLEATTMLADAISAIAQARAEGDAARAAQVWSDTSERVRSRGCAVPGN